MSSAESLSVVLTEKPTDSLSSARSLAQVLSIKKNTALQIIKNIPLRIYTDLSPQEAELIVQALNITTPLAWQVILGNKKKLPSVSWNKAPSINGMSLQELALRISPQTTGLAVACPEYLLSKANAPAEESSSEESFGSSILPTADSIVTCLSEDLEMAYFESQKNDMSDSVNLFVDDSQNIPGSSAMSRLPPGTYNLFLPTVTSHTKRTHITNLCIELLNWTSEETKEAFQKPIICVGQDLDDIEATKLIDQFESHGVTLSSKQKSKI